MKENKELEKTELTETISSASAEIAAADGISDEEELRRLRKIQLIKMGVIAALSAIIMVFVTIAWFSLNKEIGTGGMSISTTTLPFYIRTAEASGTTYWSEYKSLINLADSKYKDGDLEQVGGTNYYKTGTSAQEIIWRLEDTETGTEDSIYSVGLRPRSNGRLKFEVVPTRDGNLALDFNFGIRGFVAEYPTQEEIDAGDYEASEIKSLNEISLTGSGSSANEKNALKYINGHILFFKNKTTVNGKDIYSGFIDDVYHWKRANAVKDTGYEISVYWVWVNTIDQIIIKSTDSGIPLLADDNTTDRSAVMGYIKNDRADIFHNITSYDEYNNESEKTYDFDTVLSGLTYETYTSSGSANTRSKMENSYNAADQIIGVSINYILLDMKADLGTFDSE